MELSNNYEEEGYCLVAISLPTGDSSQPHTAQTSRDENYEYSKASFLCPIGTRLISVKEGSSSEYYFTPESKTLNECYLQTYDEERSTINVVVEDEDISSPQCFYTVGIHQEAVEDLSESQANDNQFVPDGNKEDNNLNEQVARANDACEYESLGEDGTDSGNVPLYEDTNDCLEEETVQYPVEADTFLYSDGNVYLLTEQVKDEVDLQNSVCENILQRYGYEFVNEVPNHSDEEEKVDVETLGEVVSALKCVSCDYTTLNKIFLVQHHSEVHCCGTNEENATIKDDKQSVIYICGQCSIEFLSIETCRAHMIEEHKLPDETNQSLSPSQVAEVVDNHEQPLKLGKSDKDDKTAMSKQVEDKLREYWLLQGTAKNIKARLCRDRKIRCSMRKCKFRFSTYDKMEQHKLCHFNAKDSIKLPYKCSQCDVSFSKWPQCSLHLHKSHGITLDIINCPLCQVYSVHSVKMMAAHLQKHAQKEGKFSESINSRWYSAKTCHMCQKTYVNSKILNKHIKDVHLKLKPFKCSVCGHSTSSKYILQSHTRQHTGEKPYQCEFCPYRTGDQSTLRKHQKTHTKMYTYSCKLCPYRCIQSNALRAHLKSRHPKSTEADTVNKREISS